MKITRPLSNLHTHSNFSDGRASVEDNINSAIKCGFVSLGISDHSHTYFDQYSMKAGREDEYLSHIRNLAEKYKERIDVFAGLELDSFSECNTEKFDYIIGSVHFIKVGGEYLPIDYSVDRQKEIIREYFGGREIDFVRAYFDEVVRHITSCRPDIVGHFDLLTKYDSINEASEEYRQIAVDALQRVMKTCTRFEVNTGAIARGCKASVYPASFLLQEIQKLGGTVLVTSDCHDGVRLDCAFDEALRIIRNVGFTHTDRFTSDGFVQDEIDI